MKGSIFDMFFVIVFLLLVALSTYFGHYLMSQIDITDYDSEANQTFIQNANDSLLLMDWGMAIIFASMIIVIIIFASQIYTHPLFLPIAILVSIFVILIAVIVSNIFGEIASEDILANTTSTFTVTNTIMSNLPLIIFGSLLILMIIIYGKTREEGGV